MLSCRLVIQGEGPGPRYGHVLALVAQRYLVCVSGNDGELDLVAFGLCFFGKEIVNGFQLNYRLSDNVTRFTQY